MSFSSLEFLSFLAATVAVYFALPLAVRWMWLLVASAFFYAFAGPAFLLQIAAATGFSYLMAFAIERAADPGRKRALLAIAIVVLLGNLVLFKYASFFNGVIGALTGWSGAMGEGPISLLMPLGISFYTLQIIGYLVDIHRGDKAERHLGIYSLYVLLFPKVVSGPIERGRNLLPQLHALPVFNAALAMSGVQLMLWGAFKKFVVADRIAPMVDRVFSAPHEFEGVAMTFATWLYAFQLYFDFSGYTDMALGAAMIFGIRLMQNFDRPYFAMSIQDFWKRWHISLTSWLTDYVYTPITRAKWIRIKLYNLILIALMVTFVISGFWHGSHWTFIAWGALHGSYIVLSLLLQKPWNKFAKDIGFTKFPRFYNAFRIARTFSLVCFAYILFRASSMEDALYIMTHLWTGWDRIPSGIASVVAGEMRNLAIALLGIAIIMAPEFLRDRFSPGDVLAEGPSWRRFGVQYILAVAIVLLGAFDSLNQQFIYFRF